MSIYRSLLVFVTILHVSAIHAVDQDKYWAFIESERSAAVFDLNDDTQLEKRLAIYTLASSSVESPTWVVEARQFLEKKIREENDVLYYLVLADVYHRAGIWAFSYSIASTALNTESLDERVRGRFELVAGRSLYAMIENYRFRVKQNDPSRLRVTKLGYLTESSADDQGYIILTDEDCIAWVVYLDGLNIERIVPPEKLHERLRSSGIDIPENPTTDVALNKIAWLYFAQSSIGQNYMPQKLADEKVDIKEGENSQVTVLRTKRDELLWDSILDVFSNQSDWKKHRALIDHLNDVNPLRSSAKIFGEEYPIVEMQNAVDLPVDPVTVIGSAYYKITYGLHSVGTNNLRGSRALEELRKIDASAFDLIAKSDPGLVDALFAIAYGLTGQNDLRIKHQDKAIKLNPKFHSFIESKTIIWEVMPK